MGGFVVVFFFFGLFYAHGAILVYVKRPTLLKTQTYRIWI